MRAPEPLSALRRRHRRELEEHVRWALCLCGWSLGETAELLQEYPTAISRIIQSSDELREDYAQRSPGRGRPRKSA